MEKFIDLHIHSNYSDGLLSPQEILLESSKRDAKIISITDHDTIDNLFDLRKNLIDDLIAIVGVEISSFITMKKDTQLIHILGYGVNPDDLKLNDLLRKLKDRRTEVNKEYILKLLKYFKELPTDLKTEIDCTKYYRIVREILIYLHKNGFSEELIMQIKRYCRKDLPVYDHYDINADIVIDAIKSAGGIPVLAHPMEYKLRDIELKRMIRILIEYGLEGIEAYHAECTFDYQQKLRILVESYNLLYSCGSDFHFPTSINNKIIGHGINENLCMESCTVADKILEKNLYLRKDR